MKLCIHACNVNWSQLSYLQDQMSLLLLLSFLTMLVLTTSTLSSHEGSTCPVF